MNYILLAVLWATAGDGESQEEFYQCFRGQPLSSKLELLGVPFIKRESNGLRLTLPEGRKYLGPIGISTLFAVHGDFDITATFEILHAQEPDVGFGVGAILRIAKQPPKDSATIGRLVRPAGKELLLWERSFVDFEGTPTIESGSVPYSGIVGKLRLKRTGSTLEYFYAPDADEQIFQLIHQCEFGTEDLRRVTLSGVTGRESVALDMRWLDLWIRSDGLPVVPGAIENVETYWWLAIALAGIAGAGLILYRWIRFGRPIGRINNGNSASEVV